MKRPAWLLLAASLFVTTLACNPAAAAAAPDNLPADKYAHYTGDDNKRGTLWFKQQNFTNSKTGKTIALIGMIHVADKSYYEQVQEECRKADVVLGEGVSGRDNLSSYTFFMTYLMSAYQRVADLQGCSEQIQVLREEGNWENADLTSTEFAKHRGLHHQLGMAVLLPVVVMISEPAIMSTELTGAIQKFRGKQPAHYASVRHFLNHAMEIAEEKDHAEAEDAILPGIISARNERVLERVSEKLDDPACRSIAIPWGASHMPDLELQLLDRGFSKTTHRWYRAQAVEELTTGVAQADPPPRKFYIPYLFSYRKPPRGSQTSFLFRLLNVVNFDQARVVSLGYGQIMNWTTSEKKGKRLTLLPQLFGRPLLLDYRKSAAGKGWQTKFLLFFNASSKDTSKRVETR